MATHLVDKSALTRLHLPIVRARLEPLLLYGRLATTGVSMIEILFSARNVGDFDGTFAELNAMPRIGINERVVDRAREVMRLMVVRGTHRAPSPADLVLAACAEENGLTVLHYDKDFDLIAEVTHQPTEWVVPAGSV
jgi:predicted nucleic acid-binding protein